MPKGVFPRIAHEIRFWRNVNRTSGCWEWLRARSKRGYGKFKMDGRNWRAHRASWTFERGPIPPGMCVLHKCDNPPCVRPDHLWIGTEIDNIRDRDFKNRQAKGDRNGSRLHPERLLRGDMSPSRRHPENLSHGSDHYCAKLNEKQVVEIRALYATGHYTYLKLAQMYGMGPTPIARIIKRERWKHIIGGNNGGHDIAAMARQAQDGHADRGAVHLCGHAEGR